MPESYKDLEERIYRGSHNQSMLCVSTARVKLLPPASAVEVIKTEASACVCVCVC